MGPSGGCEPRLGWLESLFPPCFVNPNMTEPAKRTRRRSEPNGLPAKSRGVLADLRLFFLQRPAVPTLIQSTSGPDREDFDQRIKQHVGVSAAEYRILNIHRIGIEAPPGYVFQELLEWSEAALCWPGHIARLERIEGSPEHIHVFLLGRKKRFLGLKNDFFGLNVVPLFKMDAIEFRQVPGPSDLPNARFLLYECSGGYPVGIFCVYVRSPLAERAEVEETQVFMVVGFDFYGRPDWPDGHIVNRVWELIHNRVTANILNRLKQLCEARIRQGRAGP
jgi:hypothetical protein